MAQEFLNSILPRRGPEAFGKFIAALMSCDQQQFVAEDLDPQLARRFRGFVASEQADVDTTDAGIIQEVTGGTCILCSLALFTTHAATWSIILVVSVCICICLSVN